MTANTTIARLACAASLLLSVSPSVASDAPAAPAAPSKHEPSAEEKEVMGYRLSMAKIEDWAKATEALTKLAASDPALKARFDAAAEKQDKTLDEKVRSTEADLPEAAKAIKAAGLSVREYMIAGLALITDSTMVGMKKQGAFKTYPDSILPENAAFLEANWDRVNEILKSVAPPESDE